MSRSEVEQIHGATVEVLERLGVKVWSPKALELFEGAGAAVDKKTMMVKVSESLLKETVRKAPSSFEYYGRDPSYKLTMGESRVHFSLCGQGVKVQDIDGRIRLAKQTDNEQMALIGDYCENIHHIAMMTTPMDVPPLAMHIYALWANLKNSVKTTDGYTHGERWANETIELGRIIRAGAEELRREPLLLGFVNPVSPMQLSKELIEGAIVYARENQPVLFAPEALAGATAPATLAGLLVQQNAEVLSGIMVAQLAKKGAPVFYGTVSAVMDMKTGSTALGGPEVGLFNLATAQLARFYRLPCRGTGGNTDSKLVDVQAGIEGGISLLMAGLAGMNFIYDAAGSIDGSITTSYEKIVVDNEMCGMVARALDGIEVNKESLAVEEIAKVGPAASYLGTLFTTRMFRKEHFIPQLMNRSSREAWERAGSRGIADAAREKAKWILKNHTPVPLEKDVSKKAEDYVKAVAKSYVGG